MHGTVDSFQGKREEKGDDRGKKFAELKSEARYDIELVKLILDNDGLFPSVCIVEYDEKADKQDRVRIGLQFSVKDDMLLGNLKSWRDVYCDVTLIWWKENPYSFLRHVAKSLVDKSDVIRAMESSSVHRICQNDIVPRDLKQEETKECLDMLRIFDEAFNYQAIKIKFEDDDFII